MPRKTLKSETITVNDYYSERFLRIETELMHQRELMKIGFDAINRRIDAILEEMNRRFETIEKRFEASDRRFESVDKRLDLLTTRMDRFMIWSFGITLTSTGLIIAAMKYWR